MTRCEAARCEAAAQGGVSAVCTTLFFSYPKVNCIKAAFIFDVLFLLFTYNTALGSLVSTTRSYINNTILCR